MKKLIVSLASCSLLFASPTSAQSNSDSDPEFQHDAPAYWTNGGWTVYKYPDEKSCDLAAQTANGEDITIAYAADRGYVALIVTNHHAKSLDNKQRVALDVVFLDDKTISSMRKGLMFTANSQGQDGSVLVSDNLDQAFLRSVAGSKLMAVMKGETFVAGVNLTGSSGAVAQLVKCSEHMGGVDPKDPFVEHP